MPVVTGLQAHKRDKEKVKLFLDEAFAMDLPLLEAARLRTGQQLSQPEVEALEQARTFQNAHDRALRFLAFRPRSCEEVRRRLLQSGFAEDLAAAVIQGLLDTGFLDDTAFARYWLENRNRFKPMGERALRYELWQKGVDAGIIDAVLSDMDAESAAYRAAQSQIKRFRGCSRQQSMRKLSASLHRRGFDSETIQDVVTRVAQELDESEDGAFGRDSSD